jgi:hypothetical protein
MLRRRLQYRFRNSEHKLIYGLIRRSREPQVESRAFDIVNSLTRRAKPGE